MKTPSQALEGRFEDAVQAILQADALYLGSGAGMGVDSGLPDFRGTEGFWKAYPPVAKLKLRFDEMANPRWFEEDPEFAWGFYGHRLNLYRETIPHEGFSILRKWGESITGGAFVYTSNVDGHFQRAGFDEAQVLECHGSINHLQCLTGCEREIWSAKDTKVEVDQSTLRAALPLPTCPNCGGLARPNVLMFGDSGWDSTRASGQQRKHHQWLVQCVSKKLAMVEVGAGTTIPTVRMNSEGLADERNNRLIRINPQDAEIPNGGISLPMGGLEALQRIDAIISAKT